MPPPTKPLFGPRYRDLLENTRSAEANQRRILRYRLLIWCLPWAPPIPFAVILTMLGLQSDARFGGLILAIVCLAPVLATLGLLDYRLKCGAGLERGGQSDSGGIKWACVFTLSQLAIALGICLLFQVNRLPDHPIRHRMPASSPTGAPTKRTILQTW